MTSSLEMSSTAHASIQSAISGSGKIRCRYSAAADISTW